VSRRTVELNLCSYRTTTSVSLSFVYVPFLIFHHFRQEEIRRASYSPVHAIPRTQLTLPNRRTLGRRHPLNRPGPHPHPPKRRRKNPNGHQNRYTVRLTPTSPLFPRLLSHPPSPSQSPSLPPAWRTRNRKRERKSGKKDHIK
jgi:hypothetical protein